MKNSTKAIARVAATFVVLVLAFAVVPQRNYAAPALQRCVLSASLASENVSFDTLEPGDIFQKTWLVHNDGTCAWPRDVQLVFVSGEPMSGPRSLSLRSVAAGERLEINIDLQTPERADSYTGVWQLQADGRAFGPSLRINVQVVEAASTELGEFVEGDRGVEKSELLETGQGPVAAVQPVIVPAIAAFPTEIPPGGSGDSFVECSEGVVTGGGWDFSPAGAPIKILRSHQQGNGWVVGIVNPTDSPAYVTSHALCLKNTTGITTGIITELTVEPFAQIHQIGTATCPAGSVVTGGGFDFVTAANALAIDFKLSRQNWGANQWIAGGDNYNTGEELLIEIWATCLLGVVATSENFGGLDNGALVLVEPMWPSAIPGYVAISCPAGWLTTGGGTNRNPTPFDDELGPNEDLLTYLNAPTANTGWQSIALNPNPVDIWLYSYVSCLLIGFPESGG